MIISLILSESDAKLEKWPFVVGQIDLLHDIIEYTIDHLQKE